MNIILGILGILVFCGLVFLLLNAAFIYLNWNNKKKRNIAIGVFLISLVVFIISLIPFKK